MDYPTTQVAVDLSLLADATPGCVSYIKHRARCDAFNHVERERDKLPSPPQGFIWETRVEESYPGDNRIAFRASIKLAPILKARPGLGAVQHLIDLTPDYPVWDEYLYRMLWRLTPHPV